MAIPTVTSVTPNSGPSSGGTTVNVVGSNFMGANKVAFGDASASFTVNGPSSLTAFSPPHVPGTVDVRVTNQDGTSTPGSGDLYFYTGSPPTVSGVSPSLGPCAGGTTVTIMGNGFLNATGVNFGSATATFTVNSDSQITAFSPPGAAGTVDVEVTNAVGTSAPTPPDRFSYQPITPTVTGLSTASGPAAGGTTLTIFGSGFLNATAVTFGNPQPQPGPGAGVSAAFVVQSANQITVFTPPHAPGTVHVQVITSDGTSAPTAADQFSFQ